jgi:hypothetical protein
VQLHLVNFGERLVISLRSLLFPMPLLHV